MTPLPSEIIFEILTRTSSLKTLDTCKAVNKEWNNLIYESNFMSQFFRKRGYFVQTLSRNKHVSEFVLMDGCSGNSKAPFHLPINDIVKPRDIFFNDDFDMKIEASTKKGILCCVRRTKNEYRYHVCKPSTKQWMKLPNPRTRYSTVKVSFIVLRSNPLHFKIIRLSSPRTPYHHYRKLGLDYCRCELFDSESWEWSQGKDLLVPQELYIDMSTPTINASGLVYVKLRDDTVMALNYNGEEAFPRFSLPKPTFEYKDYRYNLQLVEYNGKLGFTSLSPKTMELWVFENGRQVWELKKVVDIETIKRVTQFPTRIEFYNADIAMMMDYYQVIFYKLHDNSFNAVQLDKCPTVQEIFPFRSDFEPIDLRMRRANVVNSSTKHLYLPFWISLVVVFIFLFGFLFSHA